MGNVLVQLVPLLIANVAMPTGLLLVLALLSQGRGSSEAIAFVGGDTSVRLLQGLIFGIILSAYEISHHLSSPGLIISILLIVLGLLMWVMAVRQVVHTDDLNVMRVVGALTPVRALGLGALLVLTSSRAWIFTLAALAVIEQAELDIAQSITAYLLYVLGAEVLHLAPIFVSGRTSVRLATPTQWLARYNRPIVVIVSIALGSFFLWRGITGFKP